MRKRALVALLVMHAVSASAQTSALAGRVVRAGSTTPIPGAEVVLTPRGARVLTDAKGEFRFETVPAGYVMIHVRRIGFAAESLGVQLPMAAPIDIEIQETAQKLDTVSVSGREDVLARGKLAGFYERKQFGIGRFLEEKAIANMLTRRLADIIVARIPGTRAVRSAKGGMAASIDPSHVSAIEFYGGAAQMPAQYNRTGSACGALLIWTK